MRVRRSVSETDARIAELLTILRHCDCYDYTIKSFAKKLSLSPDALYARYSQEYRGVKKFMYENIGSIIMNKRVSDVRKRATERCGD